MDLWRTQKRTFGSCRPNEETGGWISWRGHASRVSTCFIPYWSFLWGQTTRSQGYGKMQRGPYSGLSLKIEEKVGRVPSFPSRSIDCARDWSTLAIKKWNGDMFPAPLLRGRFFLCSRKTLAKQKEIVGKRYALQLRRKLFKGSGDRSQCSGVLNRAVSKWFVARFREQLIWLW